MHCSINLKAPLQVLFQVLKWEVIQLERVVKQHSLILTGEKKMQEDCSLSEVLHIFEIHVSHI